MIYEPFSPLQTSLKSASSSIWKRERKAKDLPWKITAPNVPYTWGKGDS